MTSLPVVSGRQCMRALERAGFEIKRSDSTHVFMHRVLPKTSVVVPDHREVRPGTLRAIIRDAGLSVEEILGLLRP